MSLLKYNKYTILVFQRSILFISEIDSKEKSWKFDLRNDHPLQPETPRIYFSDSDEGGDEDTENLKSNDIQVVNTDINIHNIAISESSNLIAFTTGEKSLYLFKIEDHKRTLTLFSRRKIVRNSSGIIFAGDSAEFILLSDKNGDCYVFSTSDTKKPGKWIFGHMSQVLDLLITDDKRFIVTSDRDEKIRITNYPNSHDIESFCHGHEEFVSAIKFLPNSSNEILISISGDKTLRLWNCFNAKQIKSLTLPYSATKLQVKSVDENTTLLAITFFQADYFSIYEVQKLSNDEIIVNLKYKIMEKNRIVSLIFYDDKTVLMSVINANEEMELLKYRLMNEKAELVSENNCLNEIFQAHFEVIKSNFVDKTHLLFKKKYDNISEYHERKKRRLDNKK